MILSMLGVIKTDEQKILKQIDELISEYENQLNNLQKNIRKTLASISTREVDHLQYIFE